MNIGIIGAGAIATYVVEAIAENPSWNMHVKSVYVRDKEKYADFAAKNNIVLYQDIDAFLDSDIDIVVEAANVEAVETLLPVIVKRKSVVIISIGAFVNQAFLTNMKEIAKKYNHKIYLPSGAIGGLDIIQHAQKTNNLSTVTLETRKPAHTITKERVDTEQIVFHGTAEQAIKEFPKNINVAIALGLAGVGMRETKVKIIADPTVKRNHHTIVAEGTFGKASFQIENAPMPTNANTSYLAAMSVVGTLQKTNEYIQIG